MAEELEKEIGVCSAGGRLSGTLPSCLLLELPETVPACAVALMGVTLYTPATDCAYIPAYTKPRLPELMFGSLWSCVRLGC